jgi:DNA mismatch repair protein MutS2
MDAHSLERLDFLRIRELLAGYALTQLGRGLAATIKPIARESLIRRWFDQLAGLERLAQERGLPPFGGVTDVRETIRRCAPPLQVTVEDVARVGDALAGTHAIGRYLADLPEGCAELQHLAERIGDFGTVADRIRAQIDERAHMRDDASPKLARIRDEIRRATQQIRAAVERILHDSETRKLLQFPNYTFHNDRLVFPVRAECRGRLPGIIHRSSDSGATIYVEPSQAVELNNQISNLRAEEAEEIARLLWELAHEIYINAEAIIKTLDALAVLDLLVAKLRLSEDFEMRCPELSEQQMLNVRQARHPLLVDLVRRKAAAGEPVQEVVPISYRLGEDFDLLIITGPNTGGKTVTLKTVGLLSLMVQAGLPVPVAEGSRFGVFKRVLIDMGDEQSMQQSLSTFSGHLKRQMDMLRRASRDVLVLVDELGAGTDPDEGAAIGRAILDDLLRLECRCMVTTHIGALKSFPLSRARAENACVEFDLETLRPTYHLRVGEPGMSNAIAIARRLGMPRRLVNAARRNLSRKARLLRAALEETAGAKRQAEEARAAAESARLDADRAQNDADAARVSFEQQQANFEQWVRRVVHLQSGDAVRVRDFDRDGRLVRLRLDQQRAEVDVGAFTVEVPLGDVLPPETPPPPARPPRPRRPVAVEAKPAKPRERRPARPRAESRRATARAESRPGRSRRREPHKPKRHYVPLTEEHANGLQSGDTVVVKRLHREGRVVRIEPPKKVAFVSVGSFEVEVPYSGLGLPAPPQERPKKPRPPTPAKAPDEAAPERASAAPDSGEEPKDARAESPAATAAPPPADAAPAAQAGDSEAADAESRPGPAEGAGDASASTREE